MKRLTGIIAVLMLLNVLPGYSQTLPSFDNTIRAIRYNAVPGLYYSVDDYTQYAPFAVTLGLKAFGYESRSSWGRMFVSDAFSAAIMTAAVNGIKYTVGRPRPDGTSYNSFPSGHTATSFMLATMMHKEYGWKSPWFSFGAYAVAAGTGISRIINDRHYATDVIAGAIIGTAATHLGYFIADKIFRDKYINPSYEAMRPYIDPGKKYYELGLYFGYRFLFGEDIIGGGGIAGIQANIPVVPGAGICTRIGTGSIPSGFYSEPSASSHNLYNFMAGGYWSIPFLRIMEFEAKAYIGGAVSEHASGFDFAAEAHVGILSGQNFMIKAFAGYEAIPQPGRKLFSHTAIVGGSCSFAW